MKTLRILLVLVGLGIFASACNRVKCPTNTFSKVDIEAMQAVQDQQPEAVN